MPHLDAQSAVCLAMCGKNGVVATTAVGFYMDGIISNPYSWSGANMADSSTELPDAYIPWWDPCQERIQRRRAERLRGAEKCVHVAEVLRLISENASADAAASQALIKALAKVPNLQERPDVLHQMFEWMDKAETCGENARNVASLRHFLRLLPRPASTSL